MIIEKIKNMDSLPTDIENKIWERKKEEFLDAFVDKNHLYLAAGLGQRCTSGYEISIRQINIKSTEEWEVILNKKVPEKSKTLAQVITHPIAIGKVVIGDKKVPRKIIFQNKKGQVIKKVSIDSEFQE